MVFPLYNRKARQRAMPVALTSLLLITAHLVSGETLSENSFCSQGYAAATATQLANSPIPRDRCYRLSTNSLGSIVFAQETVHLHGAAENTTQALPAPVLDTAFSVGAIQPAPGRVINITGVVLERVLLFPPSSFSSRMLMPWVHRYPSSGAKLYLTNVTLVTLCDSLQQYSQAARNKTLLGSPATVVTDGTTLHITYLATSSTTLQDVSIKCDSSYSSQFNRSVARQVYVADGYGARQAFATFADMSMAGELLLLGNITLTDAPDVSPELLFSADVLVRPDRQAVRPGELCIFDYGWPWKRPRFLPGKAVTLQNLALVNVDPWLQGPSPEAVTLVPGRFLGLSEYSTEVVIVERNCTRHLPDTAFMFLVWWSITFDSSSSRVAQEARWMNAAWSGIRTTLVDDDTVVLSGSPIYGQSVQVLPTTTTSHAGVPPGFPPLQPVSLVFESYRFADERIAPVLLLAKNQESLASALEAFQAAGTANQTIRQPAGVRRYMVTDTTAGWPVAMILYNNTVTYTIPPWAAPFANTSSPSDTTGTPSSCLSLASELVIQGTANSWATLDLSPISYTTSPCLFRPTGQDGKLKLRNMVLLMGPDVPPPTTSQGSADTWLPQSLTLSQLTGLESIVRPPNSSATLLLDAMNITVSQDVFMALHVAVQLIRDVSFRGDPLLMPLAQSIISSTVFTPEARDSQMVRLASMYGFGWSAVNVTFLPGPHPGAWATVLASQPSASSNTRVLIGALVAAAFVLVIVVVALLVWRRVKRKRRASRQAGSTKLPTPAVGSPFGSGPGTNSTEFPEVVIDSAAKHAASKGHVDTKGTESTTGTFSTTYSSEQSWVLDGACFSNQSFWEQALTAAVHSSCHSATGPLAASINDINVQPVKIRGSGSTGVVMEAAYKGKPAAIKTLQFAGVTIADYQLKSFKQEVEILSRINHPNIVRLYAANLDPPCICIVEELLECSLAEVIYGTKAQPVSKPLELRQVLQLSRDIAQGLAHLHPAVIHRDLKPQNILIDAHGTAKIADFGLSRVKVKTMHKTQHPMAGTAAYMAPECATEGGNLSEKVDIFALGVIIWEMIMGQQPWKGHPPLQGHAGCLPSESDSCMQRCPPMVLRLILKCWDRDPRARPSALDVVKRIDIALKQLESPSPSPTST